MKDTRQSGGKGGKLLLLGALVATTALVLAVYRIAMGFAFFEILLWIYMIAAAGLILGYVIYNRGFSRKGITPEMLPEEWSEEEKTAYLEDGARRMRRSKWMLIPILAFVITFCVDLIELFAVPFFRAMFS